MLPQAAQNIFILDYSPRRIARDRLEALNAKTDCEEKASALLEVTRRHLDSFLEPLVAQGALAKAIQFLERQMEDLNSEKNQKAIVKIMDFIGKLKTKFFNFQQCSWHNSVNRKLDTCQNSA